MVTRELPTVFHYSAPARRRALLLSVALAVACVALVAILLGSWSRWGFSTRFVGMLLLVALLAGTREQFTRLWWRLVIRADGLTVYAPLRTQACAWSSIVEVQRIGMPQIGRGNPRWVCAILTPGRTEINRRYYVFDSDIEEASVALEFMYRYTPGARHLDLKGTK